MATIRFLSSDVDKTITMQVPSADRQTLLAIAQDHGVPILFNCDSGDCSACLVNVETLSDEKTGFAPLTEKEKYLLTSMVFLTDADVEDAEAGRVAPESRLACQYRPGGEDIVVTFENGLA